MKKCYGHIFCILLCTNFLFGQLETSKWYFGNQAGLNFVTNPPTILTNGAMTATFGCASVSDATGSILFYSNGTTVWNKFHNVMANGNSIPILSSYAGSNLIIKQPGNANIYYMFTIAGSPGPCDLTYSIIDMNLAAGSGSVTTKGAVLISNIVAYPHLTATRHCNSSDVWIVTHLNNTSNTFMSFLLTAAGLNLVPVSSSAGSFQSGTSGEGSIRISPNGNKLCLVRQALTGTSVELFDFDKTSGTVFNPQALLVSAGGNMRTSEFSPDGTKLYAARTGTLFGSHILQWDLCAGSNTAIVASCYTVTNSPFLKGDLQLASNGKIYCARFSQQQLGVINNPNNAATACNYIDTGQSLGSATCNFGLPNFMNTAFQEFPTIPGFTHTISAQPCMTAWFNAPAITQTLPAQFCSGYTLGSVLWDFGDPLSGAANSSALSNPSHFYSSVGVYNVKLMLNYGCGNIDTLSQTIQVQQSCVSLNSFSINCSNLGSATVNVSGGIGPFSYTWLPNASNASVATNLIPGSYSVSIFDIGANLNYTSSVVFNPPIPLTGSVTATNSFVCSGQNTGTATVMNISGGSGTQNYLWSNGAITYTNPSPTNLTAGQWSVTVTDALTACQINSVFTITQPPALTLNIATSSPTTCAGTSITFTATNSGGTLGAGPGYTYTWVAGPATDTHTVSEMIAGTFIYTVNSQDGNNCLSSQTIAVDFLPNPTLSVSNVSICPLEIGTLTVSGATTYTWHVPTALSMTGSSFTQSPVSSTQYTVVGSALSCTSSSLAAIIVKPIPNPFISHNSPLCENQNLLFSVSNGTAAVWSGPSAFTSAAINNTLTTANPNQSGIYAATITAINSCTASSSVSLTIKPLPSFSISPSSSSICANTTSVTLSISSSTLTSASNYSWSPNTGLSASNGTLVNAFPPATTVYTVTGTLNGCTAKAETTVHVVPPPNLTGQLSSPTLCSQAFNGSPNTITLSAGGASMYTLVTIPDMLNSNPGGPVAALTSIPPYSGPGTATLSGSNGVCTVTTSLTFTVLPNPTVTVNNYTPVICAGETFTYTNQGATTYTWSSSTPGSTLYSNGGVAVASPSINSVFSVFGGSVGCNSALQTTSITVNPLPIVNISPNPLRLCLGDTAGLFAQGNGTSFTWYPPYGLTSYTTQQVGTYINQNQQYTVVATLNNCSNTAIGHVTVLPLPLATLQALKDAVCLNDYIHLKGGGGMVYTWKTPLNALVHGPELYLKASGMALAGTYTLQVSDANACVGYSTHPVAVHNLPQGYLIPEQVEFCVPYCNSFTFVPSAQSLITQAGPWSMNNFIYSGPSFTTCFSKTGEYNISGAIQDAFNCRNVVSLSVIGRPKPTAAFYITPENPVEGLDEVSFVNVTSNIIGYSWQSAGSYSTPLGMTNLNWMSFKSEEEYPAYVFEEAGVYGLMLMVKNEFNCWDTVMHTIKVESDFAAYIPNAFTPNGDGLNDTFYPVLRGVKKFDLQIFDRWGELIFKSTELGTLWDGTFKGQECKQDIYTYKLVLLTTKREEKIYSGQLSLIR